jgi:hypothetical protein
MFKELFSDKFQSKLVTSIEEGVPTAAVTRFAEKNEAFEGKLDISKQLPIPFCASARTSIAVTWWPDSCSNATYPKGTRLITIDPDISELDDMANIALKTKAGSDLALIKGLQAIIVKEGLGRVSLSLPDAGAAYRKSRQLREFLSKSSNKQRKCWHVPSRQSSCSVKASPPNAMKVSSKNYIAWQYWSAQWTMNDLDCSQSREKQTAWHRTLLGLDETFKLNGHQAVYIALGDDYASKSLVERTFPKRLIWWCRLVTNPN